MKLGKQRPRFDKRSLKLSNYLTTALPPPPDTCDWLSNISNWGLMANDNIGDCTIAAIGHAIQTWSAVTGTEITVSDETIVSYYSRWAGYLPGIPTTDNGAVLLDILNQWRQQGFGSDPQLMHKLIAFAAVNHKSKLNLMQAINLFGGVYIGLGLPISAQDQTIWDVVPGDTPQTVPYGWGGHCVWVNYYNPDYVQCVTWGQSKKVSWAFLDKYCDEADALISQDWLPYGHDFRGLDLADMMADLMAVTR